MKEYFGLRARLMTLSPDHWCEKGHIIYCIEGTFTMDFKNRDCIEVRKGMSLHVWDDSTPHRASTRVGATLFIVD